MNQFLIDLPPAAFIVLLATFGLLIGSFLNVVIVRLPEMMARSDRKIILEASQQDIPDELLGKYNLLTPASHCPQCKSSVRWWMNIPVLSYLLLRGKCATCRTGISLQYPLVELVCAVAGGLAAWRFGNSLQAIAIAGFLWVLITLTVIDLRTQLLPDILTLPLMWAGLLLNSYNFFTSLSAAVWGAAMGYLSLWLVFHLFKLCTGKEGMGYGDFKLLAALGAWLGIGMVLPIIIFSSVSGAVFGIIAIALGRRDVTDKIPFGPYLAAGGVLSLFFGKPVVAWYLSSL